MVSSLILWRSLRVPIVEYVVKHLRGANGQRVKRFIKRIAGKTEKKAAQHSPDVLRCTKVWFKCAGTKNIEIYRGHDFVSEKTFTLAHAISL